MFIKLTDKRTGNPVFVNENAISFVYARRSQDGDITVLGMIGCENTILKVKESVEEVMKQLGVMPI